MRNLPVAAVALLAVVGFFTGVLLRALLRSVSVDSSFTLTLSTASLLAALLGVRDRDRRRPAAAVELADESLLC